ncbi:E3 ubiquitin-protein ligase TRIM56 [Holothuria leucospilota]|uniref:E3 ubiquitin-protein ligase TRIM56 n=1 Tax=Holothuria leucospilota TaxID=206669 RepID=A0A9Q1CRK9_HOLLE|nr:E3 ubiquitin-protein ligase TRIM56 [Holothuria leucospilota]
MASLIDFLEDLNKKFFRCNICLDLLRQPTQLPCLHRFCRECLQQAFSAANSELAKCPVCRDSFTKKAVDHLKSDFFTQQLIEFCAEKERSVKNDRTRRCIGCFLEQRAHSYCFKCSGFLCEECSALHVSDHVISMLNIQAFIDLTAKGMDILARMQRSQSHRTHPSNARKGMCHACQKCQLSACHSNHVTRVMENIEVSASNAYSHLMKETDHLEKVMEVNLQKCEKAISLHKDLQKKVERIIDEIKMTSLSNRGGCVEMTGQSTPTTEEQLEDIKAQREAVITYLKIVLNVQVRSITKLNTLAKSWQMRCNNLREAVDSFSSARYECQSSFVFGVPFFCDVIDDIMNQGVSYFSVATYPSNYSIAFSHSRYKGCFGVLRISSSLESRVSVDHIDSKVNICRVASSRNGRLFLSGYTNDGSSQIVETTMKGHELCRKEFQGTPKRPRRVVAFYKDGLVVTACQQDELGIFNTLDGTYFSNNIKNLVPNWSMKWVTCVTVDHAHDEIIVGSVHQTTPDDVTGNTSLEIFSPKLEYIRTMTIPSTKGTIDICCINGMIVVCDLWGRNVFTVDSNGRLLCRFAGPRVNGLQCAPRSVCVDSTGYIYVLWECNVDGSLHKLVMQSTTEGRPLTLRKVDSDSKSIAIAKSESGKQKLVVVTYRSRQVHVYSIMDDDV